MSELLIDEFPEETCTVSIDIEHSIGETPRQKFHRERLSGIGGSDVSAILGLNPYKTAHDLWLEKTGQREPDDLEGNEAVEWGNRLEDLVAEKFAEETGKRVRRNNRTLRSKLYPYMIAHLDREVVGERSILECKTLGAWHKTEEWGEAGTDNVPDRYLLQCQHYLAVSGRDLAYLSVLIGGRNFRTYIIQRDQDLIDMLVKAEGEFWQHVLDMTPPVFDPTAEGAFEAIKKLYPGTNGQTIALPDDVVSYHQTLQEQQQIVKDAESLVKSAKAAILAAMGESAIGRLPDGTCYTRKTVQREGYVVKPTAYVDFRYSKKVMS